MTYFDKNEAMAWTNFSLQDEPWAEFTTLEWLHANHALTARCSNTT